MNADYILNIINKKGFISTYNLSDDEHTIICSLYEKGIIRSLEDEGIIFMNESYIFIKKGNPDGVHVITEGVYSSLEKTK